MPWPQTHTQKRRGRAPIRDTGARGARPPPSRTKAAHPVTIAPPTDAQREAGDLVLATISRHARSLLAVARRYSLCADDAQDAYQRALEIFLRHRDDVSPDGAPA